MFLFCLNYTPRIEIGRIWINVTLHVFTTRVVHRRQLIVSPKQIKQTLIGVVILGVLYYMLSPQQSCIRDSSAGISIAEGKTAAEVVKAQKLKIIEVCGESNAW